jgi:hypothetical protein
LNPPSGDWANGQRLHVELLSVTGHIAVSPPPPFPVSIPLQANYNLRIRHVQRIQNGGNKYSNYIGTGNVSTAQFPTISSPPRWFRVNYTLQWSGFQETFVNGNTTTGPVYTNNFTPGWSLVAPPIHQEGYLNGGNSNGTIMSTYLAQGLSTNEYVISSP